MSWAAYYHYTLYQDALLVVIEPELHPTRIEKKDRVVVLYAHDTIIGMNFLHISEIIKMKAYGRIPFLPLPVFTILNDQLNNVGLPLLPMLSSSGFYVAQVKEIIDEKKAKITVKGQEVIFSYQGQLEAGDCVVVAMEGTILFSGIKVSKMHLCSDEDVGGIGNNTFIATEHNEIGKDYFVTFEKKHEL